MRGRDTRAVKEFQNCKTPRGKRRKHIDNGIGKNFLDMTPEAEARNHEQTKQTTSS